LFLLLDAARRIAFIGMGKAWRRSHLKGDRRAPGGLPCLLRCDYRGEQGRQVLWACVADAGADATVAAVAETGTAVLDGSAGQGSRVVSFLPDRHVCVVRPDQVVGTVPEALARLTPTRR
jgi:hypothetical protein